MKKRRTSKMYDYNILPKTHVGYEDDPVKILKYKFS